MRFASNLVAAGCLLVAGCGGGGQSPAPVISAAPPVVSAKAEPASFTDIGVSESGYALFNPLAPHVAGAGSLVVYQTRHDYSALSGKNTQRLMRRAGAGWELVAEFEATNPPCIMAEASGAMWAAWGNATANEAHVMRWASPSSPPLHVTISSDQGQNDKFSCVWDEGRRAFWFIGSGFELLRLDTSMRLVSSQDLMDYTAPFLTFYPALRLAPDNDLELAWMTQDLGVAGSAYRSIEYMRSGDGVSWSLNGDAPFIASPGQEVVGDETGPGFNVTASMPSATKHLVAYLSEPGGRTHFVWWHVPQTAGRCFAAPSNCTLGYRSGQSSPVTTFAAGQASPRAAVGAVLGRRGDTLWLVTAWDGQMSWFRSDDHGGSWSLVDAAPIPSAAGECIKDFTGVQTASGFAGALSLWEGDCFSWVNSPDAKGTTRVVGWSLNLS